jgi:hypothetical protein
MKIKYAVLVYQAGIANVFAVDCLNMRASGRKTTRLLQSDFRTCEAFASGLGAASVKVATAACNEAGDIANRNWDSEIYEHPFSESFNPVFCGVNSEIFFTMRSLEVASIGS